MVDRKKKAETNSSLRFAISDGERYDLGRYKIISANDEWQPLGRNMQVEAMAELNPPEIEEETTLQITPRAS